MIRKGDLVAKANGEDWNITGRIIASDYIKIPYLKVRDVKEENGVVKVWVEYLLGWYKKENLIVVK